MRHAVLTIAAIVVAACGAGWKNEIIVPTLPSEALATTTPCAHFAYTRRVPVSTTSQLGAAIGNALPGDCIDMIASTYGRFSIYRSGKPTARIILVGTGPQTTAITSTSLTSGNSLYLNHASYWTLSGFTATGGQVGIALIGSRGVVIDGVEIRNVGQAGIHLNTNATANEIRGSSIHDTGKSIKEYGEGIYVGSYYGHWPTASTPDRTDSTYIHDNVIGPNIGSDLIDVKEGTSFTRIINNTLDGTGQGHTKPWNDTWVIVQGNDVTVNGNTGRNAPVHGFRVEAQTGIAGSLTGNRVSFLGNAADVNAAGYGFKFTGGSGNSVKCANTVTRAAAGFSNRSCIP